MRRKSDGYPLSFPQTATLPKTFFIVGCIGVLFFSAVAILSYKDGALGTAIVGGFFVLWGTVLMVAYGNCRIRYDETTVTVKTFWGKKTVYRYSDITGTQRSSNGDILYFGNKKVTLSDLSCSHIMFYCYACRRYRQLCGSAVPDIPYAKTDLFHGNILSPGEFVFVYILVYVLILSWAVFMGVSIAKEEQSTDFETVFFGIAEEEAGVVLISDDGQRYVFSDIPEDFDLLPIKRICDGKTAVTVQGRIYDDDQGKPYVSVRGILAGNEVILPTESTAAIRCRTYLPLGGITVGFFILWTIIVHASIVVGRNPRKYRKLLPLFFKPGYIAPGAVHLKKKK